MKTHGWRAAAVLILTMLACALPYGRTNPTTITGLAVTPPSGEKDFILEVKYYFTWDREQGNVIIECMYTAPSGATVPIGSIFPEGLDRDNETFSKADQLPFSILPKEGRIETGTYVVGCATEIPNSLVTTTFIVTQPAAAPTPQPAIQPIPSQTPQVEIAPRKGQILFDFAGTESSRPGAGGDLTRVTELCIPDVQIDAAGILSGGCEKLHITALLVDESITVQVTGTVDPQGKISFSYEISEIGTPHGTWRISYQGQGSFTSAEQAAGTAAFSYSCNSGADNLIWCWKWTSESFSGTLPWSFIAAP